MRHFKIILITSFLFINHFVFSQWSISKIPEDSGLSQNTIRSIIQDKDGFLWIGTYDGINKYDGYTMKHYKFSNKENKLSSSLIHNLFQDKDGFIWAGTSDSGINRIKPNIGQVDVYFNDEANAENFTNVTQIYQSASGVYFYKIFNKKKFNFFNVLNHKKSSICEELIDEDGFLKNISNIQPSMDGAHWFYSQTDTIKLKKVNVHSSGKKLNFDIKETNLKAPLFDNGYLVTFIEHTNNVFYFISNELEFIEVKLNEKLEVISKKRINILDNFPSKSNLNYSIITLQSDLNNRIWIGTNDVLLAYNLNTKIVSDLSHKENYPLKDMELTTIFIDKYNILWIGSQNNGIFKLDIENQTFINSNEFVNNKKKILNPFHKYPIQAMCEDDEKTIWLGVGNKGGIAKIELNELNQNYSNLKQEPWTFNYLNTNAVFQNDAFYNIRNLYKDSKDNIWVGSGSGLSKITKNQSLSSKYKITTFNDLNKENLYTTAVFAIKEDYNGDLFAGYWGGGLVKLKYNKEKRKYDYTIFKHETNNPSSISNNYIRSITEDTNKNIWIGTVGGLNKLQYDSNGNITFENFLKNDNTDNSLSNNHVLDVYQAKNGNIYVGTFGGGLNELKINKNNEYEFKHYTTENGLISDVVYHIEEDSEGNLWMMHIKQISKLNLATGDITYFEKQDGFSVSEFIDNSMLKTSSGLILFGGLEGFTYFNPSKFSINSSKPELIITDFKLFNKVIEPFEKRKGRVILEKSINETNTILLPHNLNSIEFTFSSLHFSNPQKNQYKYILEGFDKNWQFSKGNNRKFASYTNIPPGYYTFKIFASNSSGIWTDLVKKINVKIDKPWYLTTIALILFFLIILAILYSIAKFRLSQLQLKNELRLESAVREKSEEMNQMKLQFFTNISHELRTPLTLIVGPLSQIMKGSVNPEDLLKLNSIMYKNSNRLLKLINQLLDFRKAESGNLNLIVQNGELVSFSHDIFTVFEEIAIEKGIKFLFLPSQKKINAWFDNDKIEKTLYNLLSNAFKYTPRGKSITVTLETETIDNELCAVIKIVDYGIGIPKEELQSIFERYYQTRKDLNNSDKGSGLGLAYVKHLVETHKGKISIDSEFHKGTTCMVSIPILREAYSTDSIIEPQPQMYDFKYTRIGVDNIKENQLIANQNIKIDNIHSSKTPLLLIVEDNKQLQEYLVTYFNHHYRILTADNGEIGLELTLKNIPNIIISDLMMPKMDGIEMCKRIKNDINTSHIPVIILTAKSGLENEKEGLETGADDFVVKPFNIEVLKLKIDNILRTKQQWTQKFKKSSNSKPWKELSNKLDKEFIKKSISIVEKNIDNTEFSVEKFALEIGMSKSALYAKLKSTTGQNTSGFIRTIRLNRAGELIKTGKYSIGEVVYMVGISDPKYFRTCFKKHFGCTPSNYINKIENE